MVALSVLLRMPGRRNPRLRPRPLLVSRWRRLVRLCLTLPVLLNVKRLAALREVLIFGISLLRLSQISNALRPPTGPFNHKSGPFRPTNHPRSAPITEPLSGASAAPTYCALPSGSARQAARYPVPARQFRRVTPVQVQDELSGGRETKSRA